MCFARSRLEFVNVYVKYKLYYMFRPESDVFFFRKELKQFIGWFREWHKVF